MSDFLYAIDNTNELKDQGGSFVDAGIIENLELDRIESKESKNANKFLCFYFKDLSGAEVPKTEWQPKSRDGEDAAVLKGKINKQMTRVHHMLVASGILTNEELNIKAESFEDFGTQLIRVVGDKAKGVKIRAKVVYDDNNFTTLPNYTKYIWIEPMTVSKEESKIRVLSIDKMERVQPDSEKSKVDPFETKTGSELPF
jgi:hypothetical protein